MNKCATQENDLARVENYVSGKMKDAKYMKEEGIYDKRCKISGIMMNLKIESANTCESINLQKKLELLEKDLDDKMKVVELELQSFLNTDSFNAVAETIVENTLVSSAQIGQKLENVEKKYGRLKNALLAEGILDLIGLTDD